MLDLTCEHNHRLTVRKIPTVKSAIYVTKIEQAHRTAIGTVLVLREDDRIVYRAELTLNGWVERRFE